VGVSIDEYDIKGIIRLFLRVWGVTKLGMKTKPGVKMTFALANSLIQLRQ
jgi:hypothetical protein